MDLARVGWFSAALGLALGAAGCGNSSPVPSAPVVPPPDAATLQAQVDEAIRPGIDSGRWVGAVVGVFDRGRTEVFSFGRVSPGGGLPNARTLFEIGSITKTFTCALLAGLQREGLLEEADPVSRHLPPGVTVPRLGARDITLQHLASHLSGLPRVPDDFFAQPGYDETNPYARYDEARLWAFLAGYRLSREPGASYEYSNLGGALLGTSLAWRLGAPYERALRERVTLPLGLGDTTITLSPDQRSRLATGHSARGQPVRNWDFAVFAGAGALLSSTEDLLRYAAANLGRGPAPLVGDLVSCHRSRYTAPDGSFRVGLAWHQRPLRQTGRSVIWHNGGTGGYRSYLGFLPERDAAVVVLVNCENDADAQGDLILEWLLNHS